MNKKKIAFIVAGIVGVALLGYWGYTTYQKSKTNSGNPQKDGRKFNLVNQG